MWKQYINAASIDETLQALAEGNGKARIVAGATDLMLELERGARQGVEILIDISRVRGLNKISLDRDGNIHLGPMVTHNQVIGSALMHQKAGILVEACQGVGSPQIRNRGTVAGNVITASPANDTITPLMALDAHVVLQSVGGVRDVAFKDFYMGVRRNVMRPDEMLTDIYFKAIDTNQKGAYHKFALRRAQAISVVNVAVLLRMDNGQVTGASITLGSVAPVIIHATEAEAYLAGKQLTEETIAQAAQLASDAASPITDIRGSDRFRKEIVRVATKRAIEKTLEGPQETGESPILLGNPENEAFIGESSRFDSDVSLTMNINGAPAQFKSGQHKSLLHLLREDGLMTGTKEGCGEGECGACTVILDDFAVMSCLVPAPRADGASVRTVEGLSTAEALHPVQQAFIDEGAVQCGYCTPGFVMSAVRLLEENPHPSKNQIKQAITGNLCRCTGYYAIVRAIEKAAVEGGKNG